MFALLLLYVAGSRVPTCLLTAALGLSSGPSSFAQELQERLAHSEAAAAAYATEHCDAVWLKGQYEGLKGLNAFLQEQLAEQGELLRLQGEELQELREQLCASVRCAGWLRT